MTRIVDHPDLNPFEMQAEIEEGLDTRLIDTDISRASGQTDNANAKRYVDTFEDEIVYVPSWSEWLAFDGVRWRSDGGTSALRLARNYAAALQQRARNATVGMELSTSGKMLTFANQTNSRKGIESFMSLARSDVRIAIDASRLNSQRARLNLLNGTLDLSTGELKPHEHSDYITQLAPIQFDPTAACPQWQDTLALIFDGQSDVIRYVQQLLGYAVSGLCTEQLLVILYGTGANGKSTLVNTITRLLGDYAHPTNFEFLSKTRGARHPTEIAQLYQLRFVPVSELPSDCPLNEARIKELTGSDRLTGRRMREDFWSFDPTHTFFLSTNYLPSITELDEGIRRRLKVVPFAVDLRKKVTIRKGMIDMLVAEEGSGILNWLVRGFQSWRAAEDFALPRSVEQATSDFFESQDSVGNFVTERCLSLPSARTDFASLFAAYQKHGGSIGKISFGSALEARGFQRKRLTGGVAGFTGITLKWV